MKLILQRDVIVRQWRIIATLGFAQKRPEIIAILSLAAELPGGMITGADVCRSLLADRPASVGERLLTVCHMMRLVEREEGQVGWRLTELGHRAIRNQEVPAPQRGEFDVWATDDPLHVEKILRVCPTELERAPKPGETRERTTLPSISDVPDMLLQCQGRALHPCVRAENEAHEVHFFHCEKQCRLIKEERGQLTMEIGSTGSKAMCSVSIAGRHCSFAVDAPALPLPIALAQAGYGDRVGPKPVVFTALTDDERRSARRDQILQGFALTDVGSFNSARLQDVPLIPAAQHDADEWGVWLLLDRIKGYVGVSEFERMAQDVRVLAAKNEWGVAPRFPSQRDLARRCESEPMLARKLLVPLDWESGHQHEGGTVVILSGRAAMPHERKRVVAMLGQEATRIYVLQSEGVKRDDRSASDRNGKTIIRQVRQAPDAWLQIGAGRKTGQDWRPVSKSIHGPGAPLETNEWRDIPASEIDRIFAEAKKAFWHRATHELQPDRTWLAVRSNS